MECKGCAKPLPPRKRGRRQEYCSDRCRKAAGRAAAQEASEEEKDLIRSLRGSWPVGPTRRVASHSRKPQFTRLLDIAQVVDYHACGKVLEQAIKDFYRARKDRRIRKWDTHTPSDKAEMAL
jgi:hypothetical protein